jgi:glycosyltransferase involved in cell wall biosynthesis
MKIAIYVHCFYPAHFFGTETYTLQLAKGLLALGHQVVVVAAIFPGELRQPQPITYSVYEGLPVITIDKNYFPHSRVKDTYYQPELREVHRSILAQVKPDLVHVTHLINHTGILLEEIAQLKIPVVATFTDFFGFCFNNKLHGANDRSCAGPNRRRTNCLACYIKARAAQAPPSALKSRCGEYPTSRFLAEFSDAARRLPGFRTGHLAGTVLDIAMRPDILGACYGQYRAAIAPTRFLRDAYLRAGCKVPLYEIRFGTDLPRTAKVLPVSGTPVRFGYIGQLTAHKGVDLLVAAFSRLPAGKAELHIYGPEEQDQAYMTGLRQHAGTNVHLRGTFPNERMAEILTPLDFIVIPSRWHENSPLVLLDALASHTPVIVSDVAGLTEFVTAGQSGYVFRCGSATDLERAMRRIVAHPEEGRQLRFTTDYERTSRTMTQDVAELYQQVLNGFP